MAAETMAAASRSSEKRSNSPLAHCSCSWARNRSFKVVDSGRAGWLVFLERHLGTAKAGQVDGDGLADRAVTKPSRRLSRVRNWIRVRLATCHNCNWKGSTDTVTTLRIYLPAPTFGWTQDVQRHRRPAVCAQALVRGCSLWPFEVNCTELSTTLRSGSRRPPLTVIIVAGTTCNLQIASCGALIATARSG